MENPPSPTNWRRVSITAILVLILMLIVGFTLMVHVDEYRYFSRDNYTLLPVPHMLTLLLIQILDYVGTLFLFYAAYRFAKLIVVDATKAIEYLVRVFSKKPQDVKKEEEQ